MLPPQYSPYYKQYSETDIGNDVWIGCNAVILGGVRIGDGAIIGSGATISHDVPPYAIVIGRNNHLKYRFSQQIIDELLDLKWWNFPIDRIKLLIPLLAKEPTIELIDRIRKVSMLSDL